MMLKVLFYAYPNNIYSCRKIEKPAGEYSLMVVRNSNSDFRTINDFRGKRLKRTHKIVVFSHCSAVTGIRYVSLMYSISMVAKVESASNRYTLSGVQRGKNKVKLESKKYNQSLSEVDKHIEQDKQERAPDALPDMDSWFAEKEP